MYGLNITTFKNLFLRWNLHQEWWKLVTKFLFKWTLILNYYSKNIKKILGNLSKSLLCMTLLLTEAELTMNLIHPNSNMNNKKLHISSWMDKSKISPSNPFDKSNNFSSNLEIFTNLQLKTLPIQVLWIFKRQLMIKNKEPNRKAQLIK